jgi:hypothetical protein
VLLGDLPASFVLQVLVPALHEGIGADTQRFRLEPWPEDEVKEIRLVASRRVVVTVAGVDAEESALVPLACPAPGGPTADCDHRVSIANEHLPLVRGVPIASSTAGQRYVLLLAPGHYQVFGSSLMHDLPWTEIEIAPGATDIELTISAR